MGFTRTQTVIREITGKGYLKCSAFIDSATNQVQCYRIGHVPYARPLDASQRWRRARPLPPDSVRYGSREHPTDYTGIAAECHQPGAPSTYNAREDCLQLNIWVPADEAPAGGWPVFFFIHGGFLQWGSPNGNNPSALLAETALKAVIVLPSYRLNAFGFLTSAAFRAVDHEIASNVGFWDQRLALEWTADHIAGYGGDPANITVGGLSAGAYSTFHQLAYDVLRAPKHRQLIQRAVMYSNGCGLPLKPECEAQRHVILLMEALGISTELEAAKQLASLRAVPADRLARAVEKLPENSFRAIHDPCERGAFVSPDLFADLRSGRLAQALQARHIQILAGEVRDEFNSYRLNSPPNSYTGLVQRLAVEYPEAIAARIARSYCGGAEALPPGVASWQDLFGHAYADMQVHASQRGLLSCLYPILPATSVYRYHIRWRPRCVDAVEPPAMGVAHASDSAIWWWGNAWGDGLRNDEKSVARGMIEPLARFLRGEANIGWGSQRIDEMRVLTEDGKTIELRKDVDWDAGVQRWWSLVEAMHARL